VESSNTAPVTLKANVIGLLGAVTLGVVMLSPAMTLLGAFGPSFLSAGKSAPLAFTWALLATIPTAISYALLSRDFSSSGSAANWASQSMPRGLGIWSGWMVFLYYFTNFIIQPVTMGVFLGDFLHLAGIQQSMSTYTLGVVICGLWSAAMVYRGISLSAKGALAFLLFESAVVIALCATVVWVAPSGTLSFEGFHVSTSPTGISGIAKAMIFAMMAYCGFDVVSTLAEETKMAKKLIPQATLLSLLIYAVVIVAGIWCLTYGADPAHLKEISEKGEMPITDVAKRFWGSGSMLVTLTALSASLGLAIATAVGASRVLYSMSRDGLIHAKFSVLHVRHQVPTNALHLIFGVGIFAALLVGGMIGPYNSYVWWATTSTFFAMITYLVVNFACLVLNKGRVFKSPVNFFLFGFLPSLGILIDAYILYRSFFVELWDQEWLVGKSVIVADLSAAVLVAILVCIFRRKNLSAI
jgi:amino acid transporter